LPRDLHGGVEASADLAAGRQGGQPARAGVVGPGIETLQVERAQCGIGLQCAGVPLCRVHAQGAECLLPALRPQRELARRPGKGGGLYQAPQAQFAVQAAALECALPAQGLVGGQTVESPRQCDVGLQVGTVQQQGQPVRVCKALAAQHQAAGSEGPGLQGAGVQDERVAAIAVAALALQLRNARLAQAQCGAAGAEGQLGGSGRTGDLGAGVEAAVQKGRKCAQLRGLHRGPQRQGVSPCAIQLQAVGATAQAQGVEAQSGVRIGQGPAAAQWIVIETALQ
jgi:hypothetical protein